MTFFKSAPDETFSHSGLTSDTGVNGVASAHIKLADFDDSTWVSTEQLNSDGELWIGSSVIEGVEDWTQVDTVNSIRTGIRVLMEGSHDNDVYEFRAQLFKADGVTPLTDEEVIADASQIAPGIWTEHIIDMTTLSNAFADWDDARFRLSWNYDKVKGSDNIRCLVSKAGFDGDYTGVPVSLSTEVLSAQGDTSSPALKQHHQFLASTIDAGAAVNEPALVQQHRLSAEGLSTPGWLEPVSIAQRHQLSAGISDAPVDMPNVELVLYHRYTLDYVDVIFSPSEHNVEVDHINVDAYIRGVSVTHRHKLAFSGVASEPSLPGIDIAQHHQFGVDHVVADSGLSSAAITQHYTLGALPVEAGCSVHGVSLSITHYLDAEQSDASTGISRVHIRTWERDAIIVRVEDRGGLDVSGILAQPTMRAVSLVIPDQFDPLPIDVVAGLSSASITQRHQLDADTVECDAGLSDPAIGDRAFLDVAPLDVAGDLGDASISMTHLLDASAIESASDTVGGALQHYFWRIKDVQVAYGAMVPEVNSVPTDTGTVSIAQSHGLDAEPVSALVSMPPVETKRRHQLSPAVNASRTNISGVSVGQSHSIDVSLNAATAQLSDAHLGSSHRLDATPVDVEPYLYRIDIGQDHQLVAENLSPQVDMPAVKVGIEGVLETEAIVVSPVMPGISLSRSHQLYVNWIESEVSLPGILFPHWMHAEPQSVSVSMPPVEFLPRSLLSVRSNVSRTSISGSAIKQHHSMGIESFVSTAVVWDVSLSASHMLSVQCLTPWVQMPPAFLGKYEGITLDGSPAIADVSVDYGITDVTFQLAIASSY